MDGLILVFGREQQILNGLWLGLVGMEILVLASAVFVFVSRSVRGSPKQKAQ